MSNLVENPNCWFSYPQAHLSFSGLGKVYILFIVIDIVSSTYEYEHGNRRNGDTRDGLDEERTRRSLARSAVDKILQNARLVTPHLRTRVYEKSGGMTGALNDFNSFNPTRVSTMGNVKVGISGKKAVI